jgi:hypothetical protein
MAELTYDDIMNYKNEEQSILSDYEDNLDLSWKIDRDKELKDGINDRTSKLLREQNGELINDSTTMLKAKEIGNLGLSGLDWIAEVFGGDIDYRMKAEKDGKLLSMDNKLLSETADKNLDHYDVAWMYKNAQEDPNASHVLYTTRMFDGFDEDHNEKYIYKHGVSKVSAWDRYKDQLSATGYELVDEKRFAGAEKVENLLHSLDNSLDKRVIDYGTNQDKKSNINFGSGKTELYSENLLDINDEAMEKKDFEFNKLKSMNYAKQYAKDRAKGSDNVGRAFLAGAVGLAVDVGDFVLDAIDPNGDNTLLNYSKKDIDEWVGYDRRFATEAITESVQKWKQGEYFSAVMGDFWTKAEFASESLPMMMLMGVGVEGAVAKLGKTVLDQSKYVGTLNKKLIEAQKLGKTVEAAKLEKSLNIALSKKDKLMASLDSKLTPEQMKVFKDSANIPKHFKAVDTIGKQLGFNATVGAMTNNVLDERIANGDKDITLLETMSVAASQYLLLGLDKLAFDKIVGSDKIREAFKSGYRIANPSGKKSILNKIASTGLSTAQSMGTEAVQEYVQTWGEILGARIGVDGQGNLTDILNNEKLQDEALGASLAGATSSVHMHGVGKGIQKVGELLNNSTKSNPKTYQDIANTDKVNIKDMSEALTKHFDSAIDYTDETLQDMSVSEAADMLHSDTIAKLDGKVPAEKAIEHADNMTNKFLTKLAISELDNIENNPNSSNDKLTELLKSDRLSQEAKDALDTHIAMSIMEESNSIFKKSTQGSSTIDTDIDKEMSNILGDVEPTNTSTNTSTKNPLFNNAEIKSTINKFTKVKDKLAKQNINTTMIEDALKTLNTYYTDKEYNFANKSGIDVSNEVNSIGFMYESGKVGKPSISAYNKFLPKQLLDGDISGNFVNVNKLTSFINSRKNKVDNHLDSDTTYKINTSLANTMLTENIKLQKVIDDSVKAVEDSVALTSTDKLELQGTLLDSRNVLEATNAELLNIDGTITPASDNTSVITPTTKNVDKKLTIKASNSMQRKDANKFKNANKLIAFGNSGSSTSWYASTNTESTNVGEYTSDDTVAVSLNGGKRADKTENYNKALEEVKKAVSVGATIVADNKYDREREYNKETEGELARVLSEELGYEEKVDGSGVWTKIPKTTIVSSKFSEAKTEDELKSILKDIDTKEYSKEEVKTLQNDYKKALTSIKLIPYTESTKKLSEAKTTKEAIKIYQEFKSQNTDKKIQKAYKDYYKTTLSLLNPNLSKEQKFNKVLEDFSKSYTESQLVEIGKSIKGKFDETNSKKLQAEYKRHLIRVRSNTKPILDFESTVELLKKAKTTEEVKNIGKPIARSLGSVEDRKQLRKEYASHLKRVKKLEVDTASKALNKKPLDKTENAQLLGYMRKLYKANNLQELSEINDEIMKETVPPRLVKKLTEYYNKFKKNIEKPLESDFTGLNAEIDRLIAYNRNLTEDTTEQEVIKESKYELFKDAYANNQQREFIDKADEYINSKEEFGTMLLEGLGGTGKTTTVNKAIENAGIPPKNVIYLTPTHKAKDVLKDAVDDADSIFDTLAVGLGMEMKFIKGKDNKWSEQLVTKMIFNKRTKKLEPVTPKIISVKEVSDNSKPFIVVLDEASMVTGHSQDKLETLAINNGFKIIYMGDSHQLPPITDTGKAISPISPIFETQHNVNVQLTKRMRQGEESPIIPITDVIATEIDIQRHNANAEVSLNNLKFTGKDDFKDGKGVKYVKNINESFNDMIQDFKDDPSNTRLITYNNNQNKNIIPLTNRIRTALFGSEAVVKNMFMKGEKIVMTSAVMAGADIAFNNGDIVTVIKEELREEDILHKKWDKKKGDWDTYTKKVKYLSVYVREESDNGLTDEAIIANDKHIRIPLNVSEDDYKAIMRTGNLFAKADYTYIVSTHKSQGSTYNNAYVDVGNILSAVKHKTPSEVLKSLYVATSRPRNKLTMIGVPTKNIGEYKGKLEPVEEVAYYNNRKVIRENNVLIYEDTKEPLELRPILKAPVIESSELLDLLEDFDGNGITDVDEDIRDLQNLSNKLTKLGTLGELSDKDRQTLKSTINLINKPIDKALTEIAVIKNRVDKLTAEAEQGTFLDRIKVVLARVKNILLKTSKRIDAKKSKIKELEAVKQYLDSLLVKGKVDGRSKNKLSKMFDTVITEVNNANEFKVEDRETTINIVTAMLNDANSFINSDTTLRTALKRRLQVLVSRTKLDIEKDIESINKLKDEVNSKSTDKTKWEKRQLNKQLEDISSKINRLGTVFKQKQEDFDKLSGVTKKEIKQHMYSMKKLVDRIEKLKAKRLTIISELDTDKDNKFKSILRSIVNKINKLKGQILQITRKKTVKENEVKILNNLINMLDDKPIINRLDIKDASEVIAGKLHQDSGGKLLHEQMKVSNNPLAVHASKFISVKDNVFSRIPMMFTSSNTSLTMGHIRKMLIDTNSPDNYMESITMIGNSMNNISLGEHKIVAGKHTQITDDGVLIGKQLPSGTMFDAFHFLADSHKTGTGDKYKESLIYTPQMAEAIKFGIISTVLNIKTIRNKIREMSDKDLTESIGIQGDDLLLYRDEIENGNIPNVLLMKEMRSVVMDTLGIKASKDADLAVQEAIEGSMLSVIMEQLKLQKNADGHAVVTDGKFTVGGKSYNTIKLNNKVAEELYGNLDVNRDALRDVTYLSNSRDRSKPKTTPYDVAETIVNRDIENSEDHKRLIKKNNDTPWDFNPNTKQFMNIYNSTEKGKWDVLKLFGYIEITDDMDYYEKQTQISVNEKVIRETEIMFNHFKDFTNDDGSTNQFYLEYGDTASMRNTVRSDLNYQESKIHREFIYTDAYKSNISTKPTMKKIKDIDLDNMSNEEVMEVALSQAFDLDPDKNGKFSVFNDIRKVVDIYGDVVSFHESAKDVLGISETELKALNDFINSDGSNISDISFIFDIGGMHTVKAITTLRELNQAKKDGDKTYVSTLGLEADAITSGVILSFLQVGTKAAIELAEKGGVWSKEAHTKWSNYTKVLLLEKQHELGNKELTIDDMEFSAGALIEAGKYHVEKYGDNPHTITLGNYEFTHDEPFFDIYTTVGKKALLLVKETKLNKSEEPLAHMLSELVGELTLRKVRSIFKSPLMVFNYGASMASIKRKLMQTIVAPHFLSNKKFRDNVIVESAGEDVTRQDALNAFYNNPKNFRRYDAEEDTLKSIESVDELKKYTLEERYKMITLSDDAIVKTLLNTSNKFIGNHAETVFKDTFGDIVDIREAGKQVDVVVANIFNFHMKNRIEEHRLANNGKVSKEDFIEILRKLYDDGLGHGIAINGAVQPLYKKDDLSLGNRSFISLGDESAVGTSQNINQMIFQDNSGASVTIPIHRIDGEIIQKAIDTDDFSSIYDAIIFGSNHNDIIRGTTKYNTEVISVSQSHNNFLTYVEQMNKMLDTVTEAQLTEIMNPVVDNTAVMDEIDNVEIKVAGIYGRGGKNKKGGLVHNTKLTRQYKGTNHAIQQFTTDDNVVATVEYVKNEDTNDFDADISYIGNVWIGKGNVQKKISMSVTGIKSVDEFTIDALIEKGFNDKKLARYDNFNTEEGLLTKLKDISEVTYSSEIQTNRTTATKTLAYVNRNSFSKMFKNINNAVELVSNGRDELYKDGNEIYVNHGYITGTPVVKVTVDNKNPKSIEHYVSLQKDIESKLSPINNTIREDLIKHFSEVYGKDEVTPFITNDFGKLPSVSSYISTNEKTRLSIYEDLVLWGIIDEGINSNNNNTNTNNTETTINLDNTNEILGVEDKKTKSQILKKYFDMIKNGCK